MTKNTITRIDFDNTQAEREGWALFDANGILEIQRVDEPDLPNCPVAGEHGGPVFACDDDAVLHVSKAADAGSAYHREALRLNGTTSSSHIYFSDDGEDSAPRRSQTNEEFVSDLMNFSNYGPLSQLFVIDAIVKHAERVAASDPASVEYPLIHGSAWVGVAKEIAAKCAAKYGAAQTSAGKSAQPAG